MALSTYSVFYYGHVIDETNNMIDFKEGAGPEISVAIPVGSYTLTKFVQVIVAALNAASALDWTGSVDRTTGIITFTSSGTASILFSTGSNAVSSIAALAGFNATDYNNLTSFVGSSRSGYEYKPQFPIQDYLPKEKNKELVNAVVSRSASGDTVTVQKFGEARYIKGNIKFITNNQTEGTLRFNSSAVEEAYAFMDYIIEKNPIEFMADENDRTSFDKVYLDSTPDSQNGTSYELIEYVDRNLPGYFETGRLTFRVINQE